ncbi:hypothetical protein [Streptomyces odontomachi]|nr:hypothetical protein [Streptomyces sp. ODS25]
MRNREVGAKDVAWRLIGGHLSRRNGSFPLLSADIRWVYSREVAPDPADV